MYRNNRVNYNYYNCFAELTNLTKLITDVRDELSKIKHSHADNLKLSNEKKNIQKNERTDDGNEIKKQNDSYANQKNGMY